VSLAPRLPRIAALAAAGSLLALVGNPVAPVLKARGAAPTALAFATATVVDPVNLYGEPDLRNDPSKPAVWYASGPWGTGTQRSIWNQSQDGTHTFRELHDHPDPLHTGGSILGPGGGDTEVAVDHTGKFYGADLAALITQHALTSTDRGKTFNSQPLPSVFRDSAGTDRQWFGLWDPPNPAASRAASGYTGAFPINYMTYLQAGTGSGETVASSVPVGTDTSQVGLDYACQPGAAGPALCPNWPVNGDGFVFLDQLTGKVVQAIDFNTGAPGASDQAAVEVITPDTNGYMHLGTGPADPKRPQEHKVFQLTKASTSAIFPVIAEDAQRNAYYIWVERPDAARVATSWQVYYAWSPPGADSQWDHWSAPIKVSTPPSATSIMPWAVAGGDGNLDIAWYGTDKALTDPESDNDPLTAAASWYLYMAQVQHAASASPTITQVRAVDHPMHHGSICLSGLGCILVQGNRNLADFFEITTDATGAAYIVYDNTANDLIDQVPVIEADAPEGVVDHKGAELVHVVRQIGGPGLNGGFINQPTDIGVNKITSGAGDALYDPVSGVNYPGLDILGVSLLQNDANLVAEIKVSDLSKVTAAAAAIGAPFIDFVVRFEYKSKLYFGAVELPAGQDTGLFFDGASQSIDLCSVSACDPHILTYPGPTVAPLTSHLISGQVEAATNTIRLLIPRADVGNPQKGERLDSVGAYSFAQLGSAFAPETNAQAQADQAPVEVDGACCFTPILGTQPGTGTPGPSPTPAAPGGPVTQADAGLPGTTTDGSARLLAAGALVAVLGGCGAVLGRRRRRTSS
jgi:hypothetical protein